MVTSNFIATLPLLIIALFDFRCASELKKCQSLYTFCSCGGGESFMVRIPTCLSMNFLQPSCHPCDVSDLSASNGKGICAKYSNCATCYDGIDECITCPQGRYGKYCDLGTTEFDTYGKNTEISLVSPDDFEKKCSEADLKYENKTCWTGDHGRTKWCEVTCSEEDGYIQPIYICNIKNGEWILESDFDCKTSVVETTQSKHPARNEADRARILNRRDIPSKCVLTCPGRPPRDIRNPTKLEQCFIEDQASLDRLKRDELPNTFKARNSANTLKGFLSEVQAPHGIRSPHPKKLLQKRSTDSSQQYPIFLYLFGPPSERSTPQLQGPQGQAFPYIPLQNPHPPGPSSNIGTLMNPSPNVKPLMNPSPNIQALMNPSPNIQPLMNPSPNIQALTNPSPNVQPLMNPSPNVQPLMNPSPNVQSLMNPSPNVHPLMNPSPNVQELMNPSPNIQELINPSPNIQGSMISPSNIQLPISTLQNFQMLLNPQSHTPISQPLNTQVPSNPQPNIHQQMVLPDILQPIISPPSQKMLILPQTHSPWPVQSLIAQQPNQLQTTPLSIWPQPRSFLVPSPYWQPPINYLPYMQQPLIPQPYFSRYYFPPPSPFPIVQPSYVPPGVHLPMAMFPFVGSQPMVVPPRRRLYSDSHPTGIKDLYDEAVSSDLQPMDPLPDSQEPVAQRSDTSEEEEESNVSEPHSRLLPHTVREYSHELRPQSSAPKRLKTRNPTKTYSVIRKRYETQFRM